MSFLILKTIIMVMLWDRPETWFVTTNLPGQLLIPIKPIHPEGEYLRFNWNAGNWDESS